MSISSNFTDADPWLERDPERFLDPSDVLEPGEEPPRIDVDELQRSGAVHEVAMDALEYVTYRQRLLIAEEYAGIAQVLTDAASCPDPWVGPDPTHDPEWRDPQGRSVSAVRAERRNIAERAAAMELATRLGMSEATVRTRAAHADALRERCPRVWEAFRAGQVSQQNAATTAQQAATLPLDATEAWARFDEAVAHAARTLQPGKFRLRARVARERLHPEPLDVRHKRAAADRNAWFEAEHDGMASLTVFASADRVLAAYQHSDARARHLRAQPGEERTLAQLRADSLLDLLTTTDLADPSGPRWRPSVAITVPVMTLLGHDDEPATLDGYGPIDAETARRLAGEASSWVRILTHPVTGTVLDVDRTTYRVPKALRRWLGVRDRVCIAPGCVRSARDCDIDHRLDWQYGGATADTNLAPLCKAHHTVKSKSLWQLYRDEVTGATWWISPTARTVDADPPPF
ncbi:HNH endonuclease signature motif containing protein [Microbacterium hibisci]|uniref:HNH endonuclease signature motif containing protein n=1 Tax=Microbacterium hibisci TaxID=2036000 RepID=UPI0019435A8F|nr:HNH endonuclease signature motif containing protein [Microbacterium hibisci]